MIRPLFTFTIIALATMGGLFACSSQSTTADPYVAPDGDRITEQVNHSCPNPSALLIGTAEAGEACGEGADCAPTCCQCANGSNYSWLAVHCASKICAGATQTCADTDNDGGHCELAR